MHPCVKHAALRRSPATARLAAAPLTHALLKLFISQVEVDCLQRGELSLMELYTAFVQFGLHMVQSSCAA